MTVTGRIHTLYIRDQIHAVFADVVEAAYERRHIDRHLGALRGGVNSAGLRLREAQRHIDPDFGADRLLRRTQTLPSTGVFYEGIGNPREHFPRLIEHILRRRFLLSERFNSDSRVTNQRRYGLNDFSVFGHLLAYGKPVFGSYQFFDLGVFGDQRWIRGLSIEKAKEPLDALCFFGISTVE